MCKMITSPGPFLFFQNFDFLGSWVGKRVKDGPKGQKNISVSLCISGAGNHMIVVFVTHE